MGTNVVKWLAEHAEDVALGVGSVLLSAGVALAFGYPFGLVAAGVLGIAYGVWVTPRRGN